MTDGRVHLPLPRFGVGGELTSREREDLPGRLDALAAQLSGREGLLVGFSGGVDSSFLLAAAARALPARRVVAVTAVSPALAEGELERARDLAENIGVEFVAAHTHELERSGYRTNAGDRCYHCKVELISVMQDIARARGVRDLALGTNLDDLQERHRPGLRAATERHVLTPLADARLNKAQIREASRIWGLPSWDRPQAPCLASRIAHGVQVSRSGLERVDRAEGDLRAALDVLGLRPANLRVRDLGRNRALVQLDRELLTGLRPHEGPLLAVVREAGFTDVDWDPAGFRSGSLNDVLFEPTS